MRAILVVEGGMMALRPLQVFNVAVIAVGIATAFGIRYWYGRDAVAAAYPYLLGAGSILLAIPLVPLLTRSLSRSRAADRAPSVEGKPGPSLSPFMKVLWTVVSVLAVALMLLRRLFEMYLGIDSDITAAVTIVLFASAVVVTLAYNRIVYSAWRPVGTSKPTTNP